MCKMNSLNTGTLVFKIHSRPLVFSFLRFHKPNFCLNFSFLYATLVPHPNHSSRFKDLFFRLTEQFFLIWFRECLPVTLLPVFNFNFPACSLRDYAPRKTLFGQTRDMKRSIIRGNASYFYLIWHVVNEDESFLIKEFYCSSPSSSL